MDDFFATRKSEKYSKGHTCCQLFVTDKGFVCVVRKATAHIETKTLNMRHQAQKLFCGIFVGIP